jgi:ribosome-associated toxin RatA of RatAB toxin-antitoxin module
MKPVTVAATVANSPAEVFEFLDALANHEGFLDHYLTDWEFSGPRRGVGAKARARADVVGSQDRFEFEVVEAEPPRRIAEQGVSAGGKRRTRGTYRLEGLPDGGTRIEFELAFLEVPRSERLAPFLTRAFVKRINAKAMRRLAKQLGG